ncbi:MAG: macrolide ABC transporter ATP-binding protein [Pirellulaceae bacterium]|nr:MAG: macrolide ABC transporter ATP-binding protein [Pirellulaceae bacterium]
MDESVPNRLPDGDTPYVELRNVVRTYRMGSTEVPALRGVSLEVAAGEFVVVLGVSGSGKSTLLHLVGGLDRPNAGSIRCGRYQLEALDTRGRSHYRRAMVGFVFQSFYLLPHLTARQNVEVGLLFRGVYGRQARQRASQVLEWVGLGHRLEHRPSQLSAGEQQRVALARAIVHQPPLLLADEPTASLDRTNATALLELLQNLRRQLPMTVIMVTHDEALVRPFADRAIRLRDGQVVPEA